MRASGPGRVVLGTFHHSAGDVYDVRLSDGSQLGVTARHPVWSVDQGDWVSVGDLEPDETLESLDGPVQFESATPRPEAAPVFNLEVDADHAYRVGEHGVLVHNASNESAAPSPCGQSSQCKVDDGPGTPGPYAALEPMYDDVSIAKGSDFAKKQKDRILAENRRRNGGVLRSDASDDPVTGDLQPPASIPPVTFPKPPKPRDPNGNLNEAQVDHIKPKSQMGSNSYCNGRVVSMQYNLDRR